MKTIYCIIVALIAITFLQSCEKERQRVGKGQIIDIATKEPIASTTYKLIVVGGVDNLTSKTAHATPYTFSTDANGHFEVMFESTSQDYFVVTYPNLTHFENDKALWTGSLRTRKDKSIDIGVLEAVKQ